MTTTSFNTGAELGRLLDEFQKTTADHVGVLFSRLTIAGTPQELVTLTELLEAHPAIFQEFDLDILDTITTKAALDACVLPILESGFEQFLAGVVEAVATTNIRLTAPAFNYLITDEIGKLALRASNTKTREWVSAQFKANGYCSLEEVERRGAEVR